MTVDRLDRMVVVRLLFTSLLLCILSFYTNTSMFSPWSGFSKDFGHFLFPCALFLLGLTPHAPLIAITSRWLLIIQADSMIHYDSTESFFFLCIFHCASLSLNRNAPMVSKDSPWSFVSFPSAFHLILSCLFSFHCSTRTVLHFSSACPSEFFPQSCYKSTNHA